MSIQQELLPPCFACNEGTWQGAENSNRRRVLGMCNTGDTEEGHKDEKVHNKPGF